jgi:Flp pilus assembly protein TadD
VKSLSWERLVFLLLGAITFAAYCQVGGHDFVSFDDGKYVFENPHLVPGLTLDTTTWAFTTLYFSNWHPLTWLSYLLDYELFGLLPVGYHLTNLLLHVAATMVLFAALRRLTGAVWRSAFAAALFGLHPLHVESVAWVAERKDVLSGLFWMLTLWAYAAYATRTPSIWRYLLVVLFLTLGLMAKPMLVTLPFVLLLLDFWPLGRLRGSEIRLLIAEKLPLLILVAGSSWITMIAQTRSGAVVEFDELSLGLRAGNAILAYVAYIAKTIWPTGLAVYYTHPGGSISLGLVLAASALLATLTGLALRFGGRWPYLPVGWLWYLGTLVPVIGLVQVGRQGMADRYTYLPSIGLFLIAAWGGVDLLHRWRLGRRCLAPCALAVLSALFVATWLQVGHWKNSVTLFEHALDVTPENAVAHFNLGTALLRRGEEEKAMEHHIEALRLDPRSYTLHARLAALLGKRGQLEAARRHWAVAVWMISEMDLEPSASAPQTRPDPVARHVERGTELARLSRMEEAIVQFEEALRLEPNSVEAKLGLGAAHLSRNEREKAIRLYQEALDQRPDSGRVHYKLAVALMLDDRIEEATEHASRALRDNPGARRVRYLMRKIEDEWAHAANGS